MSALTAACTVQPLSLDGLACNESHHCAAGYTCAAGICVSDSKPGGTDGGNPGGTDGGTTGGTDAGTDGGTGLPCDAQQVGLSCTVGKGECARDGTLVCADAQLQCSATPGTGSTEVCDGLDNNCDGQTDEGVTPPACTLTQGVCANAKPATCNGTAGWSNGGACDYGSNYQANETACDGLDNDCDGQVDEGIAGCVSMITLAGNGPPGFKDGPGADARFSVLKHMAQDSSGNVYVADYWNHAIRKVAPDGTVTTLAGNGVCGMKDGDASVAQLCKPWGVAVGADGKVYFSDSGNNRIRVISGGMVSTLAGSGSGNSDGDAANAKFNEPAGLAWAVDSSGNPTSDLLIADRSNAKIRKYQASTATVVTVAGNGTGGYVDGTRSSVQFYRPVDVAMASNGDLYVSEGNRIRLVPVSGTSSTVAGSTSGLSGTVNETSAGTAVRFNVPEQILLDEAAGVIYVADSANQRIRKVPLDTAQVTVSVLGSGSTSAGLLNGTGTDVRGVGINGFVKNANVYLYADQAGVIRRGIDGTGTYAGSSVSDFSGGSAGTLTNRALSTADGPGDQARLRRPQGITRDSTGNLYWVERESALIRKMDTNNVVSTLSGAAGGGYVNGSLASAKYDNMRDIKVSADGTKLYTVESTNSVVRVIDLGAQTVSTLAGPDIVSKGFADSTDRTAVKFNGPLALALGVGSTANTLYVADSLNCVVRAITIAADGVTASATTTYAGNPATYSGSTPSACPASVDGAKGTAVFHNLVGIAVDGSGTVYVADQQSTTATWIRKVNADGSVQTLYNDTSIGVPWGADMLDFDGTYLVATGDLSIYTFTTAAPFIVNNYFVASTTGFRDGPQTVAGAMEIYGITHSGTDYIITDEVNHRVRKLPKQP